MQTKLLALLAVGGIASIRAQTVTDGDARAACNGFPRYALKCVSVCLEDTKTYADI